MARNVASTQGDLQHAHSRDVSECVGFKPSAACGSIIYFAPNHVRAWRRSFYERVGGHDATWPIADDELLVRTYLQGTMHHIDRCLCIAYAVAELIAQKGDMSEVPGKRVQVLPG